MIQLTMLWPIFLTIGALARFVAEPRLRWGLRGGASYAATWLTCGYYGLFLTLLLPILAAPLLRSSLFRPPAIAVGTVALTLAAALVVPILVPQAQFTSTFTRSPPTIARLSAVPSDYLRLDRRALAQTACPGTGRAGQPAALSWNGAAGPRPAGPRRTRALDNHAGPRCRARIRA
ncbi:hypothetical protein HC891_23675 [Candidatus Gracilibacteria bacterium]|nr:hypothetical protein [Candidatus Gracilibacteria bacterium]